MDINYKKIIKDLMGQDAKEHGYKLSSMRKCFSKWEIASFDKYEDEYNCYYGITLNLLKDGEITLVAGGTKVVRNFSDEDGFIKVISEYAEFMRNEGFMIIDNNKNKPRFKGKDNDYLYQNYAEISENYRVDNNLDPEIEISERIIHVLDSIEECKGKSFSDIKENLMQIAAYYTDTLLSIEDTRFEFEDDKFAIIYNEDEQCTFPLKDVIAVWLGEHGNSMIKYACEDFLAEEDFNKIDWGVM